MKKSIICLIRGKTVIIFFLFFVQLVFSAPSDTTPYIRIDQFGYRPGDVKVAVLTDPHIGFNAADEFVPGSTYQVRQVDNDVVVFSGSPTVWKSGSTHAQSGDKGWWFDFSEVTDEGQYYLFDVEKNIGSYNFYIGDGVYFNVLKAAVRMFFYNRCSMAKEAQYAGDGWADSESFYRDKQDNNARFVRDKSNAALEKNLYGGWLDAGDYNKYVTFAEVVVHQLLDAYSQNPHAFTDDFNIPESGNGIPDILDEIMFELDWLKRMQDIEDGGVHIKNGSTTYNLGSPPSSDRAPRYYEIKCSSSSIAAAGMFAHAAIVLSELSGLADYVNDLTGRAIAAWDWYHGNPKSDQCDPQEIKAGDADRSIKDQEQMAVTAAVYLFALTDDAIYNDYVKAEYKKVENLNWWGPYRMARGDALLYYTRLANATPSIKQDIINKKISNATSQRDFYGLNANDLYRAQMPDAQYHWGSNSVKGNVGNLNYDMITFNLDPVNHSSYQEKAASMLHYFHGVNPLGMVMLSNMYSYGAENAVNELYHGWFKGSTWDNALTSTYGPAPGYLTGGPNKGYSGSTAGIKDQPPQKAYRDSNNINNSWEIVEPAIYYQSTYIKLLSKFVDARVSNVEKETPSVTVPAFFTLDQNYPNPFNSNTIINYHVHQPVHVTLDIFNIRGEKIARLADAFHAAGAY